jgi:hypothetical protein
MGDGGGSSSSNTENAESAHVSPEGRGAQQENPLASASDAEIESAVSSPGKSDLLLSAPSPGRNDPGAQVITKAYGTGQITTITTKSASSVPGAKKDVRTLIKIHDVDTNAAAKYPSSNSGTGTTLSLEQGGGNRRFLPDTSQKPPGGRWVNESDATKEEWNGVHIPIFRW